MAWQTGFGVSSGNQPYGTMPEPTLPVHGLAIRFRDEHQGAGGQPCLELRQVSATVPGRIMRRPAPGGG